MVQFQNPRNGPNRLFRRDWILLLLMSERDGELFGTIDDVAGTLRIYLEPSDGHVGFEELWSSLVRLARVGFVQTGRDAARGTHYRLTLLKGGREALAERVQRDTLYAQRIRSHGLVDPLTAEPIRLG